LHYYRARWYDANLGRFISEDPIGFAGGDVNLFGYVWNNPQGYTDPSGLQGTSAKQPALWSRTAKQEEHIRKALDQPQFQRMENLNYETSNSLFDYLSAKCWFYSKAVLGETPTGRVSGAFPKGFSKSSVPGMGEAISVLESGPETYNSIDLAMRRIHDVEDILGCQPGGSCGFTTYDPRKDSKPSGFYEDLSLWGKSKCVFWGTCPPSRK
jgi:hypothetical protein